MDKIKDLEERIEKLEKQIKKLDRQLKIDKSKKVLADSSLLCIVDPDPDSRVKIEEKYSDTNLPPKLKNFDINKAIKASRDKNNAAQRLDFWTLYHRNLNDTIINLNKSVSTVDESFLLKELHTFSLHAKRYYENIVIERLLKKGEYYTGRGNRHSYDPEKTVEWWDELLKDDSFLKDGEPIKGKMYDEIRKRHNPNDPNKENGVPIKPSRRTIRTHLQKAGRV